MRVDVVLLPQDLRPTDLAGRAVVVFDVLRATTTMTAALAAGVREVRIFSDIESARAAAAAEGDCLLAGERNCLRPDGFDLGNSPGQFVQNLHAGRRVFMATTNGTRAIVAARGAKRILIGALVNASAVARHLAAGGDDVLLLCAGTNGEIAMEDLTGCGAVIDALATQCDVELVSDRPRLALRLFQANRANLRSLLADAQGGRNVIAAGLADDIEFAARLDSLWIAGTVEPGLLSVVALSSIEAIL